MFNKPTLSFCYFAYELCLAFKAFPQTYLKLGAASFLAIAAVLQAANCHLQLSLQHTIKLRTSQKLNV